MKAFTSTQKNDRHDDYGAEYRAIMKELRNMDWRHDAACRDEDPELFFPVGTSGPALSQVTQAKAVCHRCTVASDCLAWALASGQDAGVWGGMSEDERRALKRRRTHIGTRTST